MANSNAKTPVMVLQELTVKRGLSPPEYNITHSKTGTHESEFYYKVVVAGVKAVGIGRSKQIAKHDAARNALNELADIGMYIPHQNPVQDFNPGLRNAESNSPTKMPTHNCIGMLSEFCAENKMPIPEYVELSDVGPPHCREFTYECRIASYSTRATAGTKKLARHIAASEMYEVIKNIPDKKDLEKFDNCITDIDQAMSILDKVIPNLTVPVKDYDLVIKKIMEEKNLTVDDLSDYFKECKTEDVLKRFLLELDLEYEIEMIQDNPPVGIMNISTETPVTLIYKGVDEDSVKNGLINKCFDYIHVFMH